MSEYGVTDKGFIRKRYDTIYAEMQMDIKDGTGVDVSINPQSALNVIIASVADKCAVLWEMLEKVYYSHYPSTAEGVNLDFACQFGGITREEAARTKYMIVCTGVDGTSIPVGTRIASVTSPKIFFAVYDDYAITRDSFNKATIRVLSANVGDSYTVYLGDSAYTYLCRSGDSAVDILNGLKSTITDDNFNITVDESAEKLSIVSKNAYLSHKLKLTDNMTTSEVSSIISFQSEDYAAIQLPVDTITEIVTPISGFNSCTNLGSPVYGRKRETDAELRQSYVERQAYRSSTMLESITSAIFNNVPNVTSAVAFENETDVQDSFGRPPHSIEIVVDGGDDAAIAKEILDYKAAGIQTFGSVAVEIPDLYNNTITVRFNRPSPIYVWLKVSITKNPGEAMPPNYEALIKETLMDFVSDIKAGENIVIQKAISPIGNAVTGIAYISITAFTSPDEESEPSDYTLTYISVSARQKAYFNEDRIAVEINGD